ncbi:MAG: MoxR family ATPase [Spirochaetes bacterium]|nr:MoxR family ATPase [Spirochaetota bacterium]
MTDTIQNLIQALNTILIGKEDKITKLVANILIGGNILLEDFPGVGKTIVSRAIASLIARKTKPVYFKRIQGTPDLLPYDITGVDIYDPGKKDFIFKQGPIFTDILLADELNRATPKVQSALLQAMAEKLVTVGNRTYQLPEVFFVIATQNPIESEGTYPLPAAQLDRFTCCLSLGYPDFDHELEILEKGKSEDRLHNLTPVIQVEEVLLIREKIKTIEIDPKILKTITSICQKTRHHKDIKLGLSTRAGLMMVDLLKSYALLKRRAYVIDQDLIELAEDVWSHRLILLNPQLKAADIISHITRDEVRKMLRH